MIEIISACCLMVGFLLVVSGLMNIENKTKGSLFFYLGMVLVFIAFFGLIVTECSNAKICEEEGFIYDDSIKVQEGYVGCKDPVYKNGLLERYEEKALKVEKWKQLKK